MSAALNFLNLAASAPTKADFLASDYKTISAKDSDSLEYATGFLFGALNGSVVGIEEFIPSMLNSMRGLSSALWALALMPYQVSKEMIRSCKLCAEFLRANSTPEILSQIVPELRELLLEWDTLSSSRKGELMGYAIAKHGIDLFATAGIYKGVKVYQDLRKANLTMTLETCALSTEARAKVYQESTNWQLNLN